MYIFDPESSKARPAHGDLVATPATALTRMPKKKGIVRVLYNDVSNKFKLECTKAYVYLAGVDFVFHTVNIFMHLLSITVVGILITTWWRGSYGEMEYHDFEHRSSVRNKFRKGYYSKAIKAYWNSLKTRADEDIDV